MEIKKLIKDIPDFPKEGILFRDITPILQDGAAYKEVILELAKIAKDLGVNVIVGPESRGFIFGCPLALELGIGFVPVRKPGKLPRETIKASYELEYGFDTLEMHKDAIKKGDKVLIADDLLATGGTAKAICEMVEALGGTVSGLAFVIELEALKGREKLKDYDVYSLIKY